MSTRDLINAIAAGDAIEIENAFNSVMAEKVSARIDDMRIDVAQNLFAEEVEEIEEEVELNLEDYSLEEIEEFMMSEDFEQLDEISKDTLKSYIKKTQKKSNDLAKKASSHTDAGQLAAKQGKKSLSKTHFKQAKTLLQKADRADKKRELASANLFMKL